MKRPITVAEQCGDDVGAIHGIRHVWNPIAIEVAHGDRQKLAVSIEGRRRPERSVAGAQ